MKILGIETSCDETSAALLDTDGTTFNIIAEQTASQIETHKKYGGVVPEIAGRKHAELILPVLEKVMNGHDKPDVIAVASGPGLITGLIMGVEAARTLSYLWNVPLISINHLEGHIYSVLTDTNTKIDLPTLTLLASGGHTELILIKEHGKYIRLGFTRDDAAGECFDKVAKLLGLDYPGGPELAKHAEDGDHTKVKLPRPMIDSDNLDFSFAGLKTAARYYVRDNPSYNLADVCAGAQQSIVDVLVKKTLKTIHEYNPKTLIVAGGVSANTLLRKTLKEKLEKFPETQLLFPLKDYTTDNAAMIATAGYFKAKNKNFTPWSEVKANPNWRIDQDS